MILQGNVLEVAVGSGRNFLCPDTSPRVHDIISTGHGFSRGMLRLCVAFINSFPGFVGLRHVNSVTRCLWHKAQERPAFSQVLQRGKGDKPNGNRFQQRDAGGRVSTKTDAVFLL